MSAAFAKADRELRLGYRRSLRDVAEPVRLDAEGLAANSITRIGPRWYRMRTGVTRNLIYVAPRQRGVKTRGLDPRRRPNLGNLLMDRAMEPALNQNEERIVDGAERLLDRVADGFNYG
jgi:hypothetical protein